MKAGGSQWLVLAAVIASWAWTNERVHAQVTLGSRHVAAKFAPDGTLVDIASRAQGAPILAAPVEMTIAVGGQVIRDADVPPTRVTPSPISLTVEKSSQDVQLSWRQAFAVGEDLSWKVDITNDSDERRNVTVIVA